jgi:hypothetical protein
MIEALMDLPTVDPGHNISAITGIANRIGDYRGPVKNHAPNPDGYWWGSVLTKHRWVHVQEIGRKKTVKKMLELGARVYENNTPSN